MDGGLFLGRRRRQVRLLLLTFHYHYHETWLLFVASLTARAGNGVFSAANGLPWAVRAGVSERPEEAVTNAKVEMFTCGPSLARVISELARAKLWSAAVRRCCRGQAAPTPQWLLQLSATPCIAVRIVRHARPEVSLDACTRVARNF